MKELAKRFIGKECLIYTLNGSENLVKGTLCEVTDGALLVQAEDAQEAVSLAFVTRIREWPRKANGKKKTVFA